MPVRRGTLTNYLVFGGLSPLSIIHLVNLVLTLSLVLMTGHVLSFYRLDEDFRY